MRSAVASEQAAALYCGGLEGWPACRPRHAAPAPSLPAGAGNRPPPTLVPSGPAGAGRWAARAPRSRGD